MNVLQLTRCLFWQSTKSSKKTGYNLMQLYKVTYFSWVYKFGISDLDLKPWELQLMAACTFQLLLDTG